MGPCRQGDGVIASSCACTAGLSNCCNNVIAFFYKIEYTALQDLTNRTCTDAACRFDYRSDMVIKINKPNDVTVEKHSASKKFKKQSLTPR